MNKTLDFQKEVKVRKNHICQGCGKNIEKGKTAYYTTVVDYYEGIASYYECEKCKDYFQEYCMDCSDFEFCIGENYLVGSLRGCERE